MYPSAGSHFYSDQPETGWRGVRKGVGGSSVVELAGHCGAQADGAMAIHDIVLPDCDFIMFKLVERSPEESRPSTIAEIRVVHAHTIYEIRR
jgi:hypothetical protein